MQIIENKEINEKIYIEKLENGLDILVIPKKGFLQKSVMFGTKFGSINNKFKINNEEIQVPDGIAHFLEHKVFEQESGQDALMTLVALSANPNAYTTSDHTVYFFDTIDNFDECIDMLFDFVQSPYFTDENVQKEQGIIGQEIQMYDDHPGFQVYINLLQNLYVNHPIRIDTAGTIESISKIDKETLYKVYNAFYDVSNMVVCVCGDVDVDDIIQKVKQLVPEKSKRDKIEEIFPEEPESINNEKSQKIMSINTPLFSIGFKDNNLSKRSNKQRIRFDIAVQIAMEMLIGKSSKLYQELYNQGLLTDPVDKSYNYEKDYGFAIIEGYSKKPNEIYEKLKQEIEQISSSLSKTDFDRIRKTLEGEFLFDFNNVPKIARMIFADYIKGINTLDYANEYKEVNIDDVKKVFDLFINKNNMAISVIKERDD